MTRARLAAAGDWLFFALLAFALVVDVTGGFRFGRRWYQVTATDPGHVVFVALCVTVIRHLAIRRPSLRERLTARRLARAGAIGLPVMLTRPSARSWMIATLVMAVATTIVLRDQVVLVTGVPDRGDPLFSMWRLAWVAHQIVRDPAHLFDANIFYGATNTFAYSDATLLPGLLAAPFIWMGVPVAIVHGVMFITSFLAAGLTMFLLARAVTGATAPAILGGVLFGFLPYRISTYSHLEMQGVFLMPLALYFLLRALESGRVRDGLWCGACLAAELLWSLYLGAYLGVGLAAVTILRWVGGHYRLRDRWRALAAAAVIAGAIAAPYSWPYWIARETVGERPRSEMRGFSAIPSDYGSINGMNLLSGPVLDRPITSERQLFPGLTTTAFAIVALVPPLAPMAAMSGAGVLVAFDASLGLNGALFTWLYETVPPFRAFRVPARFGMVAGLFLTLMASIGAARLSTQSRAHPVVVLAIAFAIFELRPRLQLTETPTTPPPIYAALPDAGNAVIVDLPLPADDGEYWIDPTYMYYSTFHWRRLLNGYSGFVPASYPRLIVASREFPSDDSIAVFRNAGAEFLVVHEEFYPTAKYHEVVDALALRTDVAWIATAPSPAGESRLYRVTGARATGGAR